MTELTVLVVDGLQSRELRRSVLRPRLSPDAPLPGDDLPDAIHLGAFDGSSLLSTCFVSAESCHWQPDRPAWRLRSMATDPGARGTGAGRAVLRAAAATARSHGAELLWCGAREDAVGFYQRCGWQLHGERFTTEYGPHRYMWIDL
jgi:GNAT superfamily N-acetyltransferase